MTALSMLFLIPYVPVRLLFLSPHQSYTLHVGNPKGGPCLYRGRGRQDIVFVHSVTYDCLLGQKELGLGTYFTLTFTHQTPLKDRCSQGWRQCFYS